MNHGNEERRPAANPSGAEIPGEKISPIVPRHNAAGQRSITAADVLSRRRDYAVRVFWLRADGVLVAQVFSDTAAAEKKLARVSRAGRDARLELVRLVPVQPLDDGAVSA